jgi:hypothetical protein
MVFGILYFQRMKSKLIIWYNMVGLVVVVFVLVATRVHYSIDIIAGLVMSVEVVWLVGRIMPWLDKFWSIPYELAIRAYRKATSSASIV